MRRNQNWSFCETDESISIGGGVSSVDYWQSRSVECGCKTTGYPLHSHISPSLPLPCVPVCRHISTGLYLCFPFVLLPVWQRQLLPLPLPRGFQNVVLSAYFWSTVGLTREARVLGVDSGLGRCSVSLRWTLVRFPSGFQAVRYQKISIGPWCYIGLWPMLRPWAWFNVTNRISPLTVNGAGSQLWFPADLYIYELLLICASLRETGPVVKVADCLSYGSPRGLNCSAAGEGGEWSVFWICRISHILPCVLCVCVCVCVCVFFFLYIYILIYTACSITML